MAQKPVLRGEVGCASVAREVSAEKGGMGERGCARERKTKLAQWLRFTVFLRYGGDAPGLNPFDTTKTKIEIKNKQTETRSVSELRQKSSDCALNKTNPSL